MKYPTQKAIEEIESVELVTEGGKNTGLVEKAKVITILEEFEVQLINYLEKRRLKDELTKY